jgi:hypothetical protein
MVQCGESLMGIVLVSIIIVLCVVFTESALTLVPGNRRGDVFFHWLIQLEAVVAVGCLLYVLMGDSGWIRRTPSTCFPLPPAVDERFRTARQQGLPLLGSLQGLGNQHDDFDAPLRPELDDASYCVRCLVWRDATAHHCTVCGRCCPDFDHHCGLFGRCIGGDGLTLSLSALRSRGLAVMGRGNLGFFTLLVSMTAVGFVTAIGAWIHACMHGDGGRRSASEPGGPTAPLRVRLADVALGVGTAAACGCALVACARGWWWFFAGRHKGKTRAALASKRQRSE